MLAFFLRAGKAVVGVVTKAFGSTTASSSLTMAATGWTMANIWDGIQSLWSGEATTGAPDIPESEGQYWWIPDSIEAAGQTIVTAFITTGILFCTLILVLGWKAFKRATK